MATPLACGGSKSGADGAAHIDGGRPPMGGLDGPLGRLDGGTSIEVPGAGPGLSDALPLDAMSDVAGAMDAALAADAGAQVDAGPDAPSPGPTPPLPQRVLGRTNVMVPIVGFGMATLGSANTTVAQAEALLNLAIDLGITYLDVASTYGDAEAKLKGVMKTRRKEVFLVTKIEMAANGWTRDNVVLQVQGALARMGVDQVDAVHLHALGDGWSMQQAVGAGGAVDGLTEAKRQGLVRFIGVSSHNFIPFLMQTVDTGMFDLTMCPLNFADRATYNFEGMLIPVAQKHGTAVIAMKTLGGAVDRTYDTLHVGNFAQQYNLAVRYALGLPVTTALVGLSNEQEIRTLAALAKAYTPLTADEKAQLLAMGGPLGVARAQYYGPPA
jgi:aryl-alcohol dehydrogenase-like predicted oxidoreductase